MTDVLKELNLADEGLELAVFLINKGDAGKVVSAIRVAVGMYRRIRKADTISALRGMLFDGSYVSVLQAVSILGPVVYSVATDPKEGPEFRKLLENAIS